MSDLDFNISLQMLTDQFNSSISAASSRFSGFANVVENESKQAVTSAGQLEKSLYDMLNIRTDSSIRKEINYIESSLGNLRNSIGLSDNELIRATRSAETRLKELRNELNNVESSFKSIDNAASQAGGSNGGIGNLKRSLLGFGAAYVGINEVVGGIKSVIESTRELDSLNQKLSFATGSVEEGIKKYDELKEVARSLGLEQRSLANGYAQLAAASKELNLTSDQIDQSFRGVAVAAAGMGLSAEDANGVFLALSQIAGKGKVSMEELRQQLGERLTPAMGIAAKSMGLTVAELDKLVSSGSLAAEDFLPAFGAALEQAFSEEASKNIDTVNGKMNNLSNDLTDLKEKLATSFVGDAIEGGIELLSSGIDKITQAIDSVDPNQLEELKTVIGEIGEIGGTAFSELFGLIQSLDDILGSLSASLLGLVPGFDTAEAEISGVSVVIGILSDGVKGVNIGFNVLLGTVQSVVAGIAAALSKITFGELSASLQKVSDDLFASAENSFSRAQEKALEFESSTKAALQGTSASAEENFDKMASKAEESYAKIAQSGKASSDELTQAAIASMEAQLAANNGVVDASILAQTAQKNLAIEVKETGEVIFSAMNKAKESVDSLSTEKPTQDFKKLADTLKVDLDQSLQGLSKTFTRNREALDGLISGYSDLSKQGYDAAQVLIDSLESMADKAANSTELEQLIVYWQDLGRQGKISGKQMKEGLDLAYNRLGDMLEGINTVAEAYDQFGLVTQEAAQKTANNFKEAFDVIVKDGNATKAQLQEAFRQYAEAAIAANKGVADSSLKSKAAMYDLKIETDDTGQTIVRKMDEAKKATESVKGATDYVAGGYRSMGDAAEQASNRAVNASNRTVNALQNEIQTIKQRDAALSEARGANVNSADNLGGVSIAAYSVDQIEKKLEEIGYSGSIRAKAEDIFNGFITSQQGLAYWDDNFALSNYGYVNEQIDRISSSKPGRTGGLGRGVTIPQTNNRANRTIDVNFQNGQNTLNASIPENQEDSLNNFVQSLADSRSITGR